MNPSPYKANVHAPVFDLPGGSSPSRIRTDPAHTYHIGIGKDENASMVILLVKAGHFGHAGTMDTKLDRAFERFATWCKQNKKHTSIQEFSKKLFKIQQWLVYSGFKHDLDIHDPASTAQDNRDNKLAIMYLAYPLV